MVSLLYQKVKCSALYITIISFCKEYNVYMQIKDSTKAPPTALQILPIEPKYLYSWGLYFVTNLPASYKYNTILIIVDCLTNYV